MHSMSLRSLLLILLLLCQPLCAQVPAPTQALTADGLSGAPVARFFGQSVSSNGQYLAVGAPFYGGGAGGTSPGVVVVYTRSGGQWVFLNAVQAPVPGNGDGFGYFVQFAGQQLLVGAPFSEVAGATQRGAAYVYQLNAGQFAHYQTLNPGVAVAAGDWFGFHVAADAGWLAVGVPRAGASSLGQVQLYRYDSNAELWLYHTALNGTASNGNFGQRVLLRGDRLLVGAPEEVLSGNTRGYVYEFLRTGAAAAAVYTQQQRFRPDSQILNGSAGVFGSALALSPDGSRLLVGSPFEQALVGGSQDGAVFAYTRGTGGNWTQRARIDSPAGSRAVNFGGSIVFHTDGSALIGDIRENDAAATPLGAVYQMHGNPTASYWSPGGIWRRGTGIADDFFGVSIALAGEEVIIGSSGYDDGAVANEGRAFAFASGLQLFGNGFEGQELNSR